MSFKFLSLLNNNLIISISNPCVLLPQLSHSPTDALCHQGAFISSIQSSLYDLTLCLSLQGGGKFPSLAISRERTPILFPLQNGNGWALKCLNNCRGGWALKCLNNRRSLLSISWPMIPDPINPKRIRTNNCRSANRQLSSRDGTYIYISVMQCSQYPYQYHFHNIQYLNHNFHQFLNFIQYLHHNNSTPSVNLTITIPDSVLYKSLSPVSEHYSYTHSYHSRSVTTTNQHNQHNIYIMSQISLYENIRVWKAPDSLFCIKITFQG